MFFDRCGSSSIFSRRWRRYLERSAFGSSRVNPPLDTRPCVVPKGVNLPPPCRESPPHGFKPPASLGFNATPPPATLPDLTPNTQQESEANIRGKEEKKEGRIVHRLQWFTKIFICWWIFFFFLKKTCTICIIETTSGSAAVTSLEAKETTVF